MLAYHCLLVVIYMYSGHYLVLAVETCIFYAISYPLIFKDTFPENVSGHNWNCFGGFISCLMIFRQALPWWRIRWWDKTPEAADFHSYTYLMSAHKCSLFEMSAKWKLRDVVRNRNDWQQAIRCLVYDYKYPSLTVFYIDFIHVKGLYVNSVWAYSLQHCLS